MTKPDRPKPTSGTPEGGHEVSRLHKIATAVMMTGAIAVAVTVASQSEPPSGDAPAAEVVEAPDAGAVADQDAAPGPDGGR